MSLFNSDQYPKRGRSKKVALAANKSVAVVFDQIVERWGVRHITAGSYPVHVGTSAADAAALHEPLDYGESIERVSHEGAIYFETHATQAVDVVVWWTATNVGTDRLSGFSAGDITATTT
jgi:hypothetical protein